MEKITKSDMDRFHSLAEIVLRRSRFAYFCEEIGRAFSWTLVGALPLVGLLVFGWSAKDWLLFLLIGAWSGILCDFFKFGFLKRQIMNTANQMYENNFVWTIVDSLRVGKSVAPGDHLRAKYQPGMGVIVDIVFGGVGTLVVVAMFPENLFSGLTENATLQWSVGGFVLYRVALTAWEIIEHGSRKSEDRRVRCAVGLRGVGLFLLGFLVAFIVGDEETPRFEGTEAAWWTMVVVNGSAIVGSLLCIYGMTILYSNTRWLRKYMDERNSKPSRRR